MADIDQLNFKVILNDDAFRTTVNDDIKLAESLNSKLSDIFKIHSQAKPKQIIADKGVTNAQQMLDAITQMEQKIASMSGKKLLIGDVDALNATLKQVLANLDKIVSKEQEHKSAVQGTNSALLNTKSVLRTLTQLTGAAFGLSGLRSFLSTLMEITGQFEVQKMALRTILQDIDGADKIFQDLYRFSSDSTYRFSELAKYAKQLASFGIGQNDLLETTKMLGDVASGVGASMDRVIIAYGHVKTSGFLRGIQLRSFSQNGIPILEELAKILGEVEGKAISLGDVFDKMTKREIPFEMVEQAFKNMTSEGGKFYKMQEVLSKTLAGQMNILKGRWENLLYAIGEANDGILKGAVSKVSNLIADYDAFGKKIKEMVVLFGTFQLALGTTALAMGNLGAAGTGLLGAFVRLSKQVIANPYVALAATITAAAYAVYELKTQMTGAEKVMATIDSTMAQFNKQLGAETAAYDALYNKLKLAKEGTEEYDNAKKAIMARYGDYITQLHNEGTEVSDLIGIYDALKLKIEAANKARFRDTATTNLERTYNEQIDDFYDHLFNAPKYNLLDKGYKLPQLVEAVFGWSKSQAGTVSGKAEKYFTGLQQEAIWQLVTGGISEDQLRKKAEKYEELSPILAAIPTINEIKTEFDGITDAYADGMAKFNDLFKEEAGGNGNNTFKPLEGWRKDVQATLYKLDQAFERQFMPGEEDYFQYLEKLGKRYKEVSEQKDKALEEDKHIYQQELDAIKAIDAALEGNILKDARYSRTPWRGGSSGSKDPYSDAISDLKTQVSILEKYKNAYDKLEPIFGDQTTNKLATIFGGTADDYTNIDEAIEKLISNLRKMGDEGNEAADVIETRLGVDAVSKLLKAQTELEKQQKKLEKYQATYREWAGKDFNLGGTGFEYDIRKVFSDYNTKLSGVDEKYIKAVKEAEEAHKGNVEAIAAEIEKLKELASAEKEYIRAQSQESLNNLAQSYLKDQYLLRGVNLDNLSGKTLGQIRRLREELIAISEDARRSWEGNFSYIESLLGSWGMKIGELTEDDFDNLSGMLDESTISMIKMMQAAKQSGLTLETLGEKIQSALDKGLKDLDPAEKKALGNLAKYAAKQVQSLADSFEKLGEAIGDSNLSDAAMAIGAIGQNIQAAAEGYKATGSWIGAVAGGVVDIINQIVNATAAAKEKEIQLRDAIRDVNAEVRSAQFDNSLSEGVSTVFGDNFVKGIENAVNALDELKGRLPIIEDARKEFVNWTLAQMISSPKHNASGRVTDVASSLNPENFESTQFKTSHSFWKGDTFKTLAELAKDFNMEITDVNGNLNPELLDTILEKYGDLNDGAKDWLKGASEYSKEYANAMDQIDAATKDIFGDLASDMTDKFIDNYMRMGNAVDDLSDTFANLGDSILRSFLQSYILEEILGKYKKQASDALKAYSTGEMTPEDYAAWLDGFADDVQRESETLAPAINGLIEVFKDRGLMNIDEDTANSLGSGIKSITEDTANLLASYINAIRDDVSTLRKIQETGWENINLLGASLPTLNEHLAQCAANTYNTVDRLDAVINRLDSVIGPQGTSGMVVRVENYR